MDNISVNLERLKQSFDEKKQKKYRIQSFINLSKKLTDLETEEVKDLLSESYQLLDDLSRDDKMKSKAYRTSFAKLQKKVRQKFGYTQQGQIKSEFTAMGIAIGVALGAPFIAINPAFSGLGLPIGLAIGISLGEKKEKEATEQNKVY